jgi:hypothetical protein
MAKVRIIKRKDGVIQTQHRGDQRYDDATLPRGTTPADVAEQVVVDASVLADVEDTQAQLDLAGGKLVKDVAKRPIARELADRRAAAEAVLKELEADSAVPAVVKRYLVALRDHLNVGPSRLAHPQPPAAPGRR